MRSRSLRILLTIINVIWIILLASTMVLGVFALISSDAYTHRVGLYMVCISLGIAVVQTVVGVLVKHTRKKK